MKNTNLRRILVISLVIISLIILATQSYAAKIGGGLAEGVPGDSILARESTPDGELSTQEGAVGDTSEDVSDGSNTVAVIVAIVIGVALVGVVVALIPKKKMN